MLMLNLTQQGIEKFDNQHDFERMCADILNQLGYSNVVLQAPKGGSDGGKDITYSSYDRKSHGLACCSIREDYKKKFKEDFEQRISGDYQEYYYFTNRYVTHAEKLELKRYCLDELEADLTIVDQEALRSMLETTLLEIRNRYIPLADDKQASEERRIKFHPSEIQLLYLKLLSKSDDKQLYITSTMGGKFIRHHGKLDDADDIVGKIKEFDDQEALAEIEELADLGLFTRQYGKHTEILTLAKQGYSAIQQTREQENNSGNE
jgi:hypothetical protein